MDLETAKKLNEVLKPLGYTVGKIGFELDQYEFAIQIAEISHLYNVTDKLEKERDDIRCDGAKDVQMSKFRHYDILKRHGVE